VNFLQKLSRLSEQASHPGPTLYSLFGVDAVLERILIAAWVRLILSRHHACDTASFR
jgi:hypothetical protein